MKENELLDDADGVRDEARLSKMRVAGRSLSREKGIWFEDGLNSAERDIRKAKRIELWSQEYFDLLKRHSELGALLARVKSALIKVDSTIYFITKAPVLQEKSLAPPGKKH